ncbi:MAG TPA: hypothetical protein VHV28_00395 [Solirubrobacteraceae bacterium]|nr:hypothetical protein [Solirubrobacteraceae bacterium]
MEPGVEHGEQSAAPEAARAAPAVASGLSAPEQVLALQQTAGNRAVGQLLTGGAAERRLARLDQHLPYIGALQSYMNPLNKATRLGVGRALTGDEKKLLDDVYGNALSTSIIRIRENATIIAGAGCYRTTGNIINIPDTSLPDHDLIHEAAHVWQHQNSIPFSYAASALSAMAWAQMTQGDWEKAYDYSGKLNTPWSEWNAEQQAHWIEDHRRLPAGWWRSGFWSSPPS